MSDFWSGYFWGSLNSKNDSGSDGSGCGCLLMILAIVWLIEYITDLDWTPPDIVFQFFSLPFHSVFFMLYKIWLVFSLLAVPIYKLGESDGDPLIYSILGFALSLVLWTISGIIKGFKYGVFADEGIFTGIGIGISTAWHAFLSYFIATDVSYSKLDYLFAFMTLASLAVFLLSAFSMALVKFLGNKSIFYTLGSQGITPTVITKNSFVIITAAWIVFSIGGIIWLMV